MLLFVCTALGCARAETLEELLAQARPLLPPGAGQVNSMPSDLGTARPLVAAGAPTNPVMHVEIKQAVSEAWHALIGKNFSEPLQQGDVCLLTLQARALAAPENGRGWAVVNVQVNAAPWEKTVTEVIKPGREWQRFTIPFVAKFAIPAGKGGFNISLGYQPQTLELADAQLWKFPRGFAFQRLPQPPKTYVGREPDAPWRREALERIEKLRRAQLAVSVVDAQGQPVPGVQVQIEQQRHAFGFGTAVVAARLGWDDADSRKYRAVVDENFSRIVTENDLKHFAVENWDKPGNANKNFSRETADVAINWARARGMSVRGHYLCWGNMEPWSEKLEKAGTPEEIHARILAHARTLVAFAGDRICEWDAINHPVPFNRVLTDVLGPDIYVTLLKEFRALTKTPLWINEDPIEQNRAMRFALVLEMLAARGVAPDGAGVMSHFRDSSLPSIAEQQGYLDRYARSAKRVEVTEYDIETRDDQLQADHLRDMLILHYAHPACTGFVIWGFWEKQHWRPDACMWRADWTERPSVATWREWVKGKWWTHATCATDAAGKFSAQVWEGTHQLTVVRDGQTLATHSVTVASGGTAHVQLVLKP